MDSKYHLMVELSQGNRMIISRSNNITTLESEKAEWEFNEENYIKMHLGPSPLPPKRKFIIVQVK